MTGSSHDPAAGRGAAGPSGPPAPSAPSAPPGPDATPEERELHWFRTVYRGDRMPQLTARAVVTGGLLGMLMSVSNLYTSLKLGWAFAVAITASVLSYALWNGLRALSGGRLSRMSILEMNCMQSTASAAGYSTGITVGTAFGALLLLTGGHTRWYVLAPMVFFIGMLGVFLAIPMKRQMIDVEQLKFPSGIAAAETLRSLYTEGGAALRKAYALLGALAGGAALGLLRGQPGAVSWLDRLHRYVHVPELIAFPRAITPTPRGQLIGYGFEPSGLLVAAGMLIGPRVALSMLGGSALLYLVVAPLLLSHDAAMAGAAGYVPSFVIDPATGSFYPGRWSLWAGTTLLVFASFSALAVQWRTIGRSFAIFRRRDARGAGAELAAIQVPLSWFLAGVIPAGVALVVLGWVAFRMSPVLGVVAILTSFLLALVSCRATGETDTTPVGPLGKLTQLLFAMLARGNAPVNLMSAGIAAGACSSAADLLTDLKSGYLLGANPRRQFLAQFFGVFFGVLAIVPAWYLMVPDKATLERFNPPATNMWKAVAEMLTRGLHTIPETALTAMVIAAIVGIALPVLAALAPRIGRFLPSATGLGLAWIMPFQNSLSFALGAVIAWGWARAHRQTAEAYTVPIASGLVAGESVVLALIAMAATAGRWL